MKLQSHQSPPSLCGGFLVSETYVCLSQLPSKMKCQCSPLLKATAGCELGLRASLTWPCSMASIHRGREVRSQVYLFQLPEPSTTQEKNLLQRLRYLQSHVGGQQRRLKGCHHLPLVVLHSGSLVRQELRHPDRTLTLMEAG